jgi:23S rRNA (uracil1939-C5)-methyltransferase
MKQLLHIEKLVYGGLGLARTDHGILFVRDVLPGEKVYAVPDDDVGGQKCAIPKTIVEPSPHRRKPPCKHFGICGGCDWLFGDYDVQLSSKKEIFLECLARIGKIETLPECDTFSSPEFGYRRRVQFKINRTPNAIGFFKRKSREVVPLRHCPLLQPALNSFLEDSNKILELLPQNSREIKCIEGSHHSIASSPVLQDRTSALTEIRVGDHVFIVSGDHFFQSNAYLCEQLETWGKKVIVKGEYFVDLYGGVGFLTILFHESFRRGMIIDNIESHAVSARKNLVNNGISHISTRAVSAENFLSESSLSGPAIDCLIVDPPREGLTKQVFERIINCFPSTIFYVSCNPSTQARDVGFFVRQAGYAIDRMALFDFYPNTHHIETVVTLKR